MLDKPLLISLWSDELNFIISLLEQTIQDFIINKADESEIFYLDSIRSYLEHKREVSENV